MTVRPIIFSEPMVRALLADRKTQTRRLLKPQPQANVDTWDWTWPIPGRRVTPGSVICWRNDREPRGLYRYLRYQIGDLLYVRERLGLAYWPCRATYAADGTELPYRDHSPFEKNYPRIAIPSIHMPRWASRLTLEVTAVKIERVQEISREDEIAEGTPEGMFFDCLWDSINANRAPWSSNPWVVALTFTVHKRNVDALLAERKAA